MNDKKRRQYNAMTRARQCVLDHPIVPENPLQNLKTLYGTGHERLDDTTNTQKRVGGVRWTIRDGIVFDAPMLLASVRADVAAEKARVAEGKK